MRSLVFTKVTGWYGSHSGYYEQLPKYLEQAGMEATLLRPRGGFFERVLGKLASLRHRLPAANQRQVAACWRFQRRARREDSGSLAVMLALEEQLAVLDFWPDPPLQLIGTIHFPPALWTPAKLAQLQRLRSAVVLYRRDIAFFENHVGAGRVRFIPHGVDTHFFRPDPAAGESRELLVAGQFLRDWEAVLAVAQALEKEDSPLKITAVVPKHVLELPVIRLLRGHPRVTIVSGLTDEELRGRYQAAFLALLPFRDYAASNTVVECLACGLPIVTYDNGGIRDYGGGGVFPLAAGKQPAGLLAVIAQYLAQPNLRAKVSVASRAFAEKELSWPGVAARHVEVWRELATGNTPS